MTTFATKTHSKTPANGKTTAGKKQGKNVPDLSQETEKPLISPIIQTKLTTGQPGDHYDAPADAMQQTSVQARSNVIQRSVETWGGVWDTDKYDERKDKDSFGMTRPGFRGVDISLKFTPKDSVDAELIGLTQTAQTVSGKKHPYIDGESHRESRAIQNGPERGTLIDRTDGAHNPVFGVSPLNAAKKLEDTPIFNNLTRNPTVVGNTKLPGSTANTTYQLGYRRKAGKEWESQAASLFDAPTLQDAATNSKQVFETTALAIKGNQEGMYYGSVRWGWYTNSEGEYTKIPLEAVSQTAVSSTFMKAAKVWNAAKVYGGAATIDLPIVDLKTYTAVYEDPFELMGERTPIAVLPKGTRVKIISTDIAIAYIEILEGSMAAGKKGYITNLRPYVNTKHQEKP